MSSGIRTLGSLILFVVAPLVIGVLLAFYYIPKPAVGIIRLDSDIWYGTNLLVTMQIDEARKDPQIQAVVLQIDSPGGEVVASQNMYLELQKLRREMPVVGSIDNMAASGGFYVVMAADPIFAKPSSDVANVGVWSFAPPDLGVNDMVLASGPFKLTASNRDEFLRSIEAIKQEFIETVFSQRGERIKIERTELSKGLLYSGRKAMELGLIDRLGTQNEAIEFAAKQAGLGSYEVVDLQERAFKKLFGEESAQISAPNNLPQGGIKPQHWGGEIDKKTGLRHLSPGIYLLYDPFGGYHEK